MQELQEDFYAILGVEEQATPEDIRKAYLKLAKKLHPDRYPNDSDKRAQAQADFSKVTRANEVLGDPKQREEYDAIRMLAKSRAALDLAPGDAPTQGSAVSAPSQAAQPETKGETKESWAAKHSARAKECYSKKRYQEAETAVKEAIRLDPQNVKYHTQLAEVYIARGWKTLAKTEVEAALRLKPQDAEAKALDIKLKASMPKSQDKDPDKKSSGGLLDQIKQLLTKKI